MYECIRLKYILIIDISMSTLDHEMGLVSHSQIYAIWTCEQDIGQFQQEKKTFRSLSCSQHNCNSQTEVTITSCANSKTQIMMSQHNLQ